MQTRREKIQAPQSARARSAAASALAGGSRQGAFISTETERRLNAVIDAQIVLAFRDGVTVLLFDGFASEAVNAGFHAEARAELRRQRESNPVTAPVMRDRLPEDRPINEAPAASPGEVAA